MIAIIHWGAYGVFLLAACQPLIFLLLVRRWLGPRKPTPASTESNAQKHQARQPLTAWKGRHKAHRGTLAHHA